MKNKNCATHHSRCNGEHLWLSATLIPHQLFVAHPSQSNYMRPSIYRTLIGACRTCQNLHNARRKNFVEEVKMWNHFEIIETQLCWLWFEYFSVWMDVWCEGILIISCCMDTSCWTMDLCRLEAREWYRNWPNGMDDSPLGSGAGRKERTGIS